MNCKIVVSVTHLKNIIAIAEQNAVDDPGMSPLVEIKKEGEPLIPACGDQVSIHQLAYSPNVAPKYIGR